jgi:uncharacterized membrane protein
MMSRNEPHVGAEPVEQFLGNLLRIGVIVSATVVLVGGVLYLARHGTEDHNRRRFDPPDLRRFEGQPPDLCSPRQIVEDALNFRSRGIIQLGLLVLIATPVARVLFSAAAFARHRDFLYVGLTLIVLSVLLFSLFMEQPV